jgi:hypothetical protein
MKKKKTEKKEIKFPFVILNEGLFVCDNKGDICESPDYYATVAEAEKDVLKMSESSGKVFYVAELVLLKKISKSIKIENLE